MTLARLIIPALVAGLVWVAPGGAQDTTGTITGRVVDSASQAGVPGMRVNVVGTQLNALTRDDGRYILLAVPPGAQRVRVSRIGFIAQELPVTVVAGRPVELDFVMVQSAVTLSEVVTIGYGTQRREAITGSVATVDADEANVGVVTNANQMIQGRVAGVNITTNSGEPGAGAQIRIRGGTSISASNEPLYVIDGVPINNTNTEAAGVDPDGGSDADAPALPRSPLNLLNPSDIASITILKDASATAIYGSRGANGVVLIETKKGTVGKPTMTYDGYVAMAQPAGQLDVLTGTEYRRFIEQQVQAGNLPAERLQSLGTANTDWEEEVTRSAPTQNHNLSFAGGVQSTQYRASLNYMDQEGVVLNNGFQRTQGRLNATHQMFEGRLRLGLNLTSSQVKNEYIQFENAGGFEGGVFNNVALFNPTQPIRVTDPETGQSRFFEIGTGRQSVRNPVALTEQILDHATTNRTLGNVTAEFDLISSLTAQLNVGTDRSASVRRLYLPKASPAGAEWGGRARQVERDNTAITLQTLLTYRGRYADTHELEVVGGYEYADYETAEFGAEGRNFLTDAFSFNNLGGGATLVLPFSSAEKSRLVSFFTRANYGLADKYFLTGVLRRDGSSRFGAGNKWAVFPAISASWRISAEPFMQNAPIGLSDLRLRAGWGLQGNPGVPPYASLQLLEPSAGVRYVFGDQIVTGVAPTRNPNAALKWEETSQTNVAVDYGFLENRFSGSLEYYIKNTSDLLLNVFVPQPAVVDTVLDNVGEVRNRGFEFSLDARVIDRERLNWTTGLVFARERNEVVDLGGRTFIGSGRVSGQGQSGQLSQRIIPGQPLGTFWGPTFVGVTADGRQEFRCTSTDTRCVNGRTTEYSVASTGILGDANPDFTLGLRSNVNWGNFDGSFLIRAAQGFEVFNNTALVYQSKANVKQGYNFLRDALSDRDNINESAKFSSRWIEDGSFVRLQNVTVGYTFNLPMLAGDGRSTRVYLSGDNLILLTDYSGYDPEVHAEVGLASRGIDYLSYPRPRTFTGGVQVTF